MTFEEIQYQVKGRFRWNLAAKAWDVSYRPLRDYWILLLLSVSERLFALQVPKVIPSKIRAQYEEQEELIRMKESLSKGEFTYKPPEGIDRKYINVKDIHYPTFQMDRNKTEAGVKFDVDNLFAFKE